MERSIVPTAYRVAAKLHRLSITLERKRCRHPARHQQLCGVTYKEWEATLPQIVRDDVIFRVQAFRLASFLGACTELDTRHVVRDRRFVKSAAQLCAASGSISATIADGYPRRSGADRARFFEYALTSTAEVKSWYLHTRISLPPGTLEARYALLTSITRLLLTMIRSSRARDDTDPP
jgi:four helix bundle protein